LSLLEVQESIMVNEEKAMAEVSQKKALES
jgi:hypothetical protein